MAGYEKDINQQVDGSTDFDSITNVEMSVGVNSKVYSCDDPPIPTPDIVKKKQRYLATLISFILMLFIHIQNLNDTIANLKVEISDLKTELNKSRFEKPITGKNCLFYTNIDKIALLNLLHEKIAPHQSLDQVPNFFQKMNSF